MPRRLLFPAIHGKPKGKAKRDHGRACAGAWVEIGPEGHLPVLALLAEPAQVGHPAAAEKEKKKRKKKILFFPAGHSIVSGIAAGQKKSVSKTVRR